MVKFLAALFAWLLCSFLSHSHALVAFFARRRMPLYNLVWVNGKKSATYQGAGARLEYMGYETKYDSACDPTWHDYPSLMEVYGRLCHIIIIIIFFYSPLSRIFG